MCVAQTPSPRHQSAETGRWSSGTRHAERPFRGGGPRASAVGGNIGALAHCDIVSLAMWQDGLLQFQENSTEREQLGQRLIAGCQQQPRGRNAALCAIRLRSNATDHGRVHRLSSCMTGSMLSKRPSLAPRKDLLELECRMSEGRRPDPEGTTWCLTLKGHGRNVTINGLGWPLMTRSLP